MPRAEKQNPWIGPALGGAAVLLDLSWQSQYFNFDGVACAVAIELSDFKHLVHGNHLAYGIIGWTFDRLLREIGYSGPAILSLQILGAILGGVGVAAFYSLSRRAGHDERLSAAAAAALAVSHAWWFWSIEAQVYTLGAVFAIFAAREAFAAKPRPAVVGALTGLAALGHIGHAMALPALLWLNPKHRARTIFAAAAVVSAAYLAAGIFAVRPATLHEVRLWLLGSASMGIGRSFDWHSAAPINALLGWLRNLLRIFSEFWGLSGSEFAVGLFLAILPLAAVASGAYTKERRARFWLYWLAGYAALFLLWEPNTIVYRVIDLVGLWSLALLGLRRIPRRFAAGAVAAWSVCAFAHNLTSVVIPQSQPESNADLVEARFVAASTPESAWILAWGRVEIYDPYFAHRRPITWRYFPDADALAARLAAVGADPVYVTSRSIELSGHGPDLAGFLLRPVAADKGMTLYKISWNLKSKASRSAANKKS